MLGNDALACDKSWVRVTTGLVLVGLVLSAPFAKASDNNSECVREIEQATIGQVPEVLEKLRKLNCNMEIVKQQIVLRFPDSQHLLENSEEAADNIINVNMRRDGWTLQMQFREAQGTSSDLICTGLSQIGMELNTQTKLVFTSEDQIYDLEIPALELKTEVMPGRLSMTQLDTSSAGSFAGTFSVAFDGAKNSQSFSIQVLEQAAFAEWQKSVLKSGQCKRGS